MTARHRTVLVEERHGSKPGPSEAGARLARALSSALASTCTTVAPGVSVAPRALNVGLQAGEFDSLARPSMLEVQFGRFLTWLAIQRGYVVEGSIEVRLRSDLEALPNEPRISVMRNTADNVIWL
jgi:hypothetical protein